MTGGTLRGRIICSSGGFYDVAVGRQVYRCRARGLFRKEEVRPVVGDLAEIQPLPDHQGYVTALAERKNYLLRPPLANLDRLVLVVSLRDPAPNLLVLDRLIAIAEHQSIEPVIALTKWDLGGGEPLAEVYRRAGFAVYPASSVTGEGAGALGELLRQGVSAFCGNSGAGKSSLLNLLEPSLALKTGETSKKLGRGRHTTRHVELYPFGEGFLADTPGFSAVEMERVARLKKEELAGCFREFEPFLGQCRFLDCAHLDEPGCRVRQAVKEGQIAQSRYDHYRLMYEEAKQYKEWEQK